MKFRNIVLILLLVFISASCEIIDFLNREPSKFEIINGQWQILHIKTIDTFFVPEKISTVIFKADSYGQDASEGNLVFNYGEDSLPFSIYVIQIGRTTNFDIYFVRPTERNYPIEKIAGIPKTILNSFLITDDHKTFMYSCEFNDGILHMKHDSALITFRRLN